MNWGAILAIGIGIGHLAGTATDISGWVVIIGMLLLAIIGAGDEI